MVKLRNPPQMTIGWAGMGSNSWNRMAVSDLKFLSTDLGVEPDIWRI
jgi:hypothetical protein